MGQSSLPILNKTGRSICWTNIWDDLHYYNIKFEEDIFIKIFFELFFKNNIYKYTVLINNTYLSKLQNIYVPDYYYNRITNQNFFFFLIKDLIISKKFIFYFMRFHILRIESVVVIFLNIFLF